MKRCPFKKNRGDGHQEMTVLNPTVTADRHPQKILIMKNLQRTDVSMTVNIHIINVCVSIYICICVCIYKGEF